MNNKIDKNNKFLLANQVETETEEARSKRYQGLLDADKSVQKTEEQIKRESYKEHTIKQQPLYLNLKFDDMLNEISRDAGLPKKTLLRRYAEDAIKRDIKKINN